MLKDPSLCPCCNGTGLVKSVQPYIDEWGDTLHVLVDHQGRVWNELTDRAELPPHATEPEEAD